METIEKKCAIVIDEQLPLGLIANTATILGVTLGKQAPELVGSNMTDQSDVEHLGIVKTPVPILKTSKEYLHELREQSLSDFYSDVTVVGFSNTAQRCKTYQEYLEKLKQVSFSDYHFLGLGFYGVKKKVNRLTGSLPLLR